MFDCRFNCIDPYKYPTLNLTYTRGWSVGPLRVALVIILVREIRYFQRAVEHNAFFGQLFDFMMVKHKYSSSNGSVPVLWQWTVKNVLYYLKSEFLKFFLKRPVFSCIFRLTSRRRKKHFKIPILILKKWINMECDGIFLISMRWAECPVFDQIDQNLDRCLYYEYKNIIIYLMTCSHVICYGGPV